MTKKAKEKSLDLFDFSSKQDNKETKKKSRKSSNSIKKNKKNTNKIVGSNKKNVEKTKDEKFSFDEEIIIGLKRIDEEQDKTNKSNIKNNKKSNKKIKTKEKRENIKSRETKKDKTKKKVKEEKKLTPKQELAKKKRQAVFRVVKWTTLLFIIIGGTIYTLLSPIFNIKNINVIGNSKISSEEITSLSKINLEENMFKYRTKEVIKNIKENAYIDKVKISRKFPDTIEIDVTERQASFMIKIANAYALINNQGYILEVTSKKEQLPIIIGIKTEQENIQIGGRLCEEDLIKLGDILKIMKACVSNDISELVTKIDITNKDDYILLLEKNKKTVYIGDISNLSTKMSWILVFNELEKDTKGDIILNMNLNDDNNKPYFREKI